MVPKFPANPGILWKRIISRSPKGHLPSGIMAGATEIKKFENEGKGRPEETSSNEIMAVQDLLHHDPEEGDFEFCL